MKIALCLHGYYNSSGGSESGDFGFDYITKNIIVGNNVDVFVHSWDLSAKDKILQNYKPTSSLFEEQKSFEEELSKIDTDWFEEDFDRSKTMYRNSVLQTLSFLYSRKVSVELKRKYEQDNGFEYDCVVLCRFDLGSRGKEHPQLFYATDIEFSPSADLNKLHMKYWNQFNWGIADHWFYSSSKTIDQVAGLYDKIEEYYQKDSDYVKAVTTGWPESNVENEFSNEIFLKNKTDNLVKFDKWHCIDNHKIYKWFFHETGLSKQIGFGDPISNHSNNFSIVMYSHSSYSDSWPMFFGQTDKYFNNCKKYIFCDDDCSLVPDNWVCVKYDENLPYNKRVASCLEKVEEQIIIFHHEDMPLYLKPKYDELDRVCEILKKEKIDFVKLLKGGTTHEDPQYKFYRNLFKITDSAHYMAVQPTLWKTKSLQKVYEKANVSHIREFENLASSICIDEEIRGIYTYAGEPKVGMHHYSSRVYPYVATAISAGKWNTKEYKKELLQLSREYEIDLQERGTND
tara:strand:+ start:187 stop:1725 length:1539 start_codon:yes stop_codon:yes gene_type:complete